ncbi:hypothetical protein HW555_007625, partial [Spodoptera exigua]
GRFVHAKDIDIRRTSFSSPYHRNITVIIETRAAVATADFFLINPTVFALFVRTPVHCEISRVLNTCYTESGVRGNERWGARGAASAVPRSPPPPFNARRAPSMAAARRRTAAARGEVSYETRR